MPFFLFACFLGAIIYYVLQPNTKKSKKAGKKDFFYVDGQPMHKINRSDGITEIASGSGHYITPYEAYFSGISKLETPCPMEILKPENTNVYFYFKENKTKDFPILLEIIKDMPNLKKGEEIYSVSVPMSDWKKVKSIFDIVKKWKHSKILLKDNDIDKSLFSKMLQCLESKEASKTKQWCDDFYVERNYPQCIGCRRLGISTLYFDDFLEEKENYFRIKKEDILKIIQEKAQTLKFCPFWDSKKIWEHYLRIIPAISFNDKRFVCIKEDGEIRAEIRDDIYEPLSSIKQYTVGKILSKK